MKVCDLHCHSICSDGSLQPEEIVALAQKQGLSALALTDHNTTKGLKAFMQAGKQAGLETVAGCEFSTEFEGKELHIVGLFMPEESWVEIEDYVELLHMAKHHSNEKLIKRLCEGGYAITYEEIAALTDASEFNRAHVARALLARGYISTLQEAFETLLKKGGGYYTPARKLGAAATVRFIKANGGVAVWAHPFFSKKEEEVAAILPALKAAGLDAIETRYSTYTPEQQAAAEKLAAQFELLESGGSDYHGEAKPDISLGTGRGNLQIPYAFYERLRERKTTNSR